MNIPIPACRESREHAADQHRDRAACRPARRRLRLVARLGQTRIGRHHPAAHDALEPVGVAQIDDVELLRRGGSSSASGGDGGRSRCEFGRRGEDRALAIRAAGWAGVFLDPGNGVAAVADYGVERQRVFGSIHVAPIFELWLDASRERVTASESPKQPEMRPLRGRASSLMLRAPGFSMPIGGLFLLLAAKRVYAIAHIRVTKRLGETLTGRGMRRVFGCTGESRSGGDSAYYVFRRVRQTRPRRDKTSFRAQNRAARTQKSRSRRSGFF
ncbi:hypothetical protein BRPE64_ACDS06110 [Caballeronia insecticola]|uniref:Uncharacterized protein n=1 Tax=Caballeronia insecticola TaxID=758793 RepID=R4WNC1_9BURK|nr:hypothetical protein BRPE64_ACDS06110 [Caballeronia insecticola]